MLVTCFCATRNRREWLPQAIANFQAQTYKDKRLLIVADGEDVQDLKPFDPEFRISLCIVPESMRPRTLGEKFNLCCEQDNLSGSEVFCKWDDDDYSAPGRIADQVARLEASGKAVTGYNCMRFTDGKSWWHYAGPRDHFALGTSLCFRRDWWEKHPFPAKQVGSDVAFVTAAANARQIASVPAGDMMVATIHPENTSPRKTANRNSYRPLAQFQGVPGFSWKVAA